MATSSKDCQWCILSDVKNTNLTFIYCDCNISDRYYVLSRYAAYLNSYFNMQKDNALSIHINLKSYDSLESGS
jgi:hypothetical protein